MAKITLETVSSGYLSAAQLTANFQKIQDEFNDSVLYRDNPDSEPNSMSDQLDMNSNRILNAGDAVNPSDVPNWGQVLSVSGGGGGATPNDLLFLNLNHFTDEPNKGSYRLAYENFLGVPALLINPTDIAAGGGDTGERAVIIGTHDVTNGTISHTFTATGAYLPNVVQYNPTIPTDQVRQKVFNLLGSVTHQTEPVASNSQVTVTWLVDNTVGSEKSAGVLSTGQVYGSDPTLAPHFVTLDYFNNNAPGAADFYTLTNTINTEQLTMTYTELLGANTVIWTPVDINKTTTYGFVTDTTVGSEITAGFLASGQGYGTAPTSDSHFVTKKYFEDNAGAGSVGEAPVDGTAYVRKDNAWINEGSFATDYISTKDTFNNTTDFGTHGSVNVEYGDITGSPAFLWNPTNANQTSAYLFTCDNTSGSEKNAGFLATGQAIFETPTSSGHGATKGYVDSNAVLTTGTQNIGGAKTFTDATTVVQTLTSLGEIASATLTSSGNLVQIGALGILENGPATSTFAAASHNHSTSDITSGILSTSRGGTGTTSNTGTGSNVKSVSPTFTGTVVANRMAIGNPSASPTSSVELIIDSTLAVEGAATGTGTDAVLSFGVLTNKSSDARLKKNIEDSTKGLDTLKQLRPRTFTWKDGHGDDVGFIAQELNPILPEAAPYNEEKDEWYFREAPIVSVLVKAVQELSNQVDALKSQLDSISS